MKGYDRINIRQLNRWKIMPTEIIPAFCKSQFINILYIAENN